MATMEPRQLIRLHATNAYALVLDAPCPTPRSNYVIPFSIQTSRVEVNSVVELSWDVVEWSHLESSVVESHVRGLLHSQGADLCVQQVQQLTGNLHLCVSDLFPETNALWAWFEREKETKALGLAQANVERVLSLVEDVRLQLQRSADDMIAADLAKQRADERVHKLEQQWWNTDAWIKWNAQTDPLPLQLVRPNTDLSSEGLEKSEPEWRVHCDTWILVRQSYARQLERAYQRWQHGRGTASFVMWMDKKQYDIRFETMQQVRVKTQTIRSLRRAEKRMSVKREPGTEGTELTRLLAFHASANTRVALLSTAGWPSWLPSYQSTLPGWGDWLRSVSLNVDDVVPIDCQARTVCSQPVGDTEGLATTCARLGWKEVPSGLTTIRWVQNAQWVRDFLAEERRVGADMVQSGKTPMQAQWPHWLFHGTSQSALSAILHEGMQLPHMHANGTRNGAMHGQGLYGACSIATAMQYTDNAVGRPRCVLLCRGLTGNVQLSANQNVSRSIGDTLTLDTTLRHHSAADDDVSPTQFCFFQHHRLLPVAVLEFAPLTL